MATCPFLCLFFLHVFFPLPPKSLDPYLYYVIQPQNTCYTFLFVFIPSLVSHLSFPFFPVHSWVSVFNILILWLFFSFSVINMRIYKSQYLWLTGAKTSQAHANKRPGGREAWVKVARINDEWVYWAGTETIGRLKNPY